MMNSAAKSLRVHFSYRHISDNILTGLVRLVELMVATTMLWGVATTDWLLVAVCLGILASMLAIDGVEIWSGLRFPAELKCYFVVFFYFSMFWGGYINFYERFWWYDIALHLTSMAVLTVSVFVFLHVLQRVGYIRLLPWLQAVVAFSVAGTVGALWEVFEFVADTYFGQTMQAGNRDTMLDLIFNSTGSLAASIAAYRYARSGHSFVIGGIVRRFFDNNP